MIRTLVGVIAMIAAVLWCPLWFQFVLLLAGILVLRYRLLLLIPAIVADVLYAPSDTLSIAHLKLTMITGVMLLVWYAVMHETRIAHLYETK